jgi:hypothetical protein
MRLSSSSSPSAAEGRINKPNPIHTHTTSQTANQIDQTANQINRINQTDSQPDHQTISRTITTCVSASGRKRPTSVS